MRYFSLYAYHFIYYITFGLSTFLPKYYAEIGMNDAQIGVLTSVPAVIALAFMPMLGALSDRVPKKRYLLLAGLLCMAGACFAVLLSSSFVWLLVVISVFTIFSVSVAPVATTISLEYCREAGRAYGPIRLLGTVGYQAGALLVGALLAKSLNSIYPLIGTVILLACMSTLMMPDVRGHQYSKRKVPLRELFRDRHVCWLLGLILFATISSQFYISFFTKHLGDLGMDNTTASWITMLSVMPELLFLMFGDRITRLTSMWNWLLVGMLLNGVRWLGLAFCRTAAPIIAFQLLGVSVMACFEFMPAYYLNQRVKPEQVGSAQSMLSLTTFGLGKIIGSLLGGLICGYTGIPAVFAFNGAALLVGCVIFWRPTRRLIAEEREETAQA